MDNQCVICNLFVYLGKALQQRLIVFFLKSYRHCIYRLSLKVHHVMLLLS